MSWSEALWKYCIKPQEFPKDVIKWNESFVAINDGYPKSKIHILILPRVKIDGIQLLAPDHVQLLKDMKSFAFQTISDMDLDDKNLKMGFHAIPSMKQLHMHVISMDLEGKGLKKKHHYNSFVTEFFLEIDAIIDKLKSGKLNLDKEYYENLLKVPLVCFKCGIGFKFLPKLLDHVKNCPIP